MGCWELSRWLVFARALQLAASLAAAAMHGAVTVRVYVGPLGLSTHMVVLELLIFVVLGYSILALSFCRSKRRRIVLAGFALCDVFFCAVALILVVLLDHAGLPLNCGGMTTIRFSDESPGQRGELDVLCHFERFYYAITVALLYMFTANLTVLCIMKQRYARTAGVNEVDGVEGGINLKLLGTPSPHDEPPTPNLPPAHLPSEGIMTRGTSLRSAVTAATVPSSSRQAASPSALPSSNPTPSRRPADVHPPTIPRRPLAQASSSSSRTSAAAVFTSGPVDEAEQDAAAAAAHVADGLQYQPKAQQHGHDHHHHHDYRNPSREFPGMAVLSEEEQAAHQALVTDGMRPSSDSPPPRYEPRKS